MIFLLNVLLALAWMGLTGQFDPLNFSIGFLLAYVMLRLVQMPGMPNSYFNRVSKLFRFLIFYLKELFFSNLRVALTVLSPKMKIAPAVVAIPLEDDSDLSIVLLGNLITLTPGSLAVDVSADRRVLYVHTMHAEDIDEFRLRIKDLERRVLEVTQ